MESVHLRHMWIIKTSDWSSLISSRADFVRPRYIQVLCCDFFMLFSTDESGVSVAEETNKRHASNTNHTILRDERHPIFLHQEKKSTRSWKLAPLLPEFGCNKQWKHHRGYSICWKFIFWPLFTYIPLTHTARASRSYLMRGRGWMGSSLTVNRGDAFDNLC